MEGPIDMERKGCGVTPDVGVQSKYIVFMNN